MERRAEGARRGEWKRGIIVLWFASYFGLLLLLLREMPLASGQQHCFLEETIALEPPDWREWTFCYSYFFVTFR